MMSFVTCGRRIFTASDGESHSYISFKKIILIYIGLYEGAAVADNQWNSWEEAKKGLARAIKQLSLVILAEFQKTLGPPPAGDSSESLQRRQSAQLRDILPMSVSAPIPTTVERRNSAVPDPNPPSPSVKPRPAIPSKHTKPQLLSRSAPSPEEQRCVALLLVQMVVAPLNTLLTGKFRTQDRPFPRERVNPAPRRDHREIQILGKPWSKP